MADIATEAILGSAFLREHRFLVDVAGGLSVVGPGGGTRRGRRRPAGW